MTKEERKELFLDICARLPYDVVVSVEFVDGGGEETLDARDLVDIEDSVYDETENEYPVYKPYLRTLSETNMTELESVYYNTKFPFANATEKMDWLNAHHFDYRGLIGKGIALEAPKDMYEF